MDSRSITQNMLTSIIRERDTWDTLLPVFVRELYVYDESHRKDMVSRVLNVAMGELPQESYDAFVERFASSMPRYGNVSYHNIGRFGPSGILDGAFGSNGLAMSAMLKRAKLKNLKEGDEIIGAVLNSLLVMDEESAVKTMKGIIYNSLKFKRADCVNYTSVWLNVVADMEYDSVINILTLGKKALGLLPKKYVRQSQDVIERAALLLTEEKRMRVLSAMEQV